MDLLKKAIRIGKEKGVFTTVGKTVTNTVLPKLKEKKAASKDKKICPGCQKTYAKDMNFCPACGEKLSDPPAPEGTVCTACGTKNGIDDKFCCACGAGLVKAGAPDESVCTACGTKNGANDKFCNGCGARLPQADRLEQNAAVMAEWDEKLAPYPKWSCGGYGLYLECLEEDGYMLAADFHGDEQAAHRAVEEYRQILLQNGFYMAGQYPDMSHLYKQINGVCYHVDTEHCFEGDSDCPTIGFDNREPYGGLDYTAPSSSGSSWKNFFR